MCIECTVVINNMVVFCLVIVRQINSMRVRVDSISRESIISGFVVGHIKIHDHVDVIFIIVVHVMMTTNYQLVYYFLLRIS